MRQNPHVRICGGPGSATTLVYPTGNRTAVPVEPPTDPRYARRYAVHRFRNERFMALDIRRTDPEAG